MKKFVRTINFNSPKIKLEKPKENRGLNKQLNLDDYYLYKIVDKGKFLFAAMKYNLNYTFVNPRLMS